MRIPETPATVAVRFFLHPVVMLEESHKAGRPITRDVEVCEIRFAANKQTIGVFPAHDVCGWVTDPATGYRTEQTYAMKYAEQYRAFLSGNPNPTIGTPLEALDFLSPSKRLQLKGLGVMNAEALAALDGAPLRALGMGGRDLKDRAQAYIEEAKVHAGDTRMADIIAEQDRRIAELEARLNAAAEGGDGAGAEPAADPASPFTDWADEDIRNWLAENDPDTKADRRWGHARLVERADEVNAALASREKAAA